MFDQVCGSDKVRKEFSKNFEVSSIEDMWMRETKPFREKTKKYFLYR
jgi:uncharacterized protein YbbC (DUF1343 family)